MRSLVVIIALAACGRRGFDADASVGTQTDARGCTEPPADCQTPEIFECGGQCFVTCRQRVSRAAAAVVCDSWGGCLATITTDLANNCAASRLTGREVWIGATQTANAASVASDWSWCDGSMLAFTAWGTNEPNDGSDNLEDGAQQCAAIRGDALWFDFDCGAVYEVICSRPL